MNRCYGGRMSIALLGLVTLCGCASRSTTGGTTAGVIEATQPETSPVNAYVQQMRDELSRGKVGLINGVMQLNSEEAKVFWPIYQEYETKLFALGDRRIEVIKWFAGNQLGGALNDTEAPHLAKAYFEFESDRLELLKSYHDLIADQLSPVHAAQFTQIEHRVGTVIDLLIAAELPMIQQQGKRGAAVVETTQ